MNYKLVAATTAVGLTLTGVTGCSSVDRQTISDPAAAQAIPTPSAPVLTNEEAAKIYLQLSAASNAAREAWMSAQAPTPATLPEHQQLAAGAADATVAFSRELRQHRWPGKAQPYVTALDKHLQVRAAAYRRVVAADSVSSYLAAAGEVPVTTSLTGEVRKALGLPKSAVVTGATPS